MCIVTDDGSIRRGLFIKPWSQRTLLRCDRAKHVWALSSSFASYLVAGSTATGRTGSESDELSKVGVAQAAAASAIADATEAAAAASKAATAAAQAVQSAASAAVTAWLTSEEAEAEQDNVVEALEEVRVYADDVLDEIEQMPGIGLLKCCFVHVV